MKRTFVVIPLCLSSAIFAQNVGIGTTVPTARLHIKGNADTSQLIVDANAVQSNARPLIRLRNAAGKDLMWIHSDDTTNSFLGLNAGRMNNAPGNGKWNTFVGVNAGYLNTTGNQNTAIGYRAFENNVSGFENTASGYQALFFNKTGNNNTAIGYGALYYNVAGSAATAVGAYAMQFATNTTTGFTNDNVAVGFSALRGSFFLNTGTQNTAIGYRTLEGNATGFQNTATGYKALHLNSTGDYNTATGGYALYNNSSGELGGDQNTATGYASLYGNIQGTNNTANGYFALYNNNTAIGNTAMGHSAMLKTTSGGYNTAVGRDALDENVTGEFNTVVGGIAGNNGPNDSYNTALGYFANVATGVSNSVVLGYSAYTNTDDLALLGNTTTKYCGGYVGWTTYVSDGRLKTRVDEEVKGLDFIMRLRPVTYHVNVGALYDLQGISAYGKENASLSAKMKSQVDKSIREKEAIRMSGFIAQEVEKAAQETGYDFDGVKKPTNDKDNYGLTYATFVVPLVKAIQEQQAAMTAMQKRIELLEVQNKMLLTLINKK